MVASVLDLIGNTPLVRLKSKHEGQGEVWAKLEMFNPGGSVKDRIALGMVEHAEQSGQLEQGMTIIEPTSGNTGIGLAIVAAIKGYKMKVVMPESMSIERRAVLSYLGAELVLTPADDGMAGSVAECERIVSLGDVFCPSQFSNKANPLTHEQTTGEEIYRQTDGQIDAVVCGIGTGGTITGIGRALINKGLSVQLIGVEPASSPVLSGGSPGRHLIQGIGAGFVPDVLDRKLVTEIITVSDDDAIDTARRLSQEQGLFAGISSGAAVWVAHEVARRLGKDARVITILPDTGSRYLSMYRNCEC